MCGIFGMFGHKEASKLTYLGLYALQHRGEESAGIVSTSGSSVYSRKGMGLVNDVFDEAALKSLKGSIAIGHVRYSTTGSSVAKNIQPFTVNYRRQSLSVAHNGNFTNTARLHDTMERTGSIFQTTMDSEIILHLIAASQKPAMKEKVVDAVGKLEGAYSLVLLVGAMLIGARDPYGFRPLCLGKLDGAWVLASETCAFDLIGAEYVRDIEPGEIVFITAEGLESVKPYPQVKPAHCIFEFIYFARPDSVIFGKNVYMTRKRLGERLADEDGAGCDCVMPVPDSGVYASIGFAARARLPYEMGLIRNHYVGRTFIQPGQGIRDFKVRIKLNPIKDALKGKRVAVIEDSIVRGTTSKARVRALRQAGAAAIHMRVSCPPLQYPCFYGIDFPTRKELIASTRTIAQIKEYIGVDSLVYLSLEGMLDAMPLPCGSFCTACFTGKYPTKIFGKVAKQALER